MLSGASALNNLDQALQTIRNDVMRLDKQLSQLSNGLTNNQQRKLTIINSIAKIRLSEIDKGSLLSNLQGQLSAADQLVAQTLQQREASLIELNKQIEQSTKDIEVLEQQRETELAKVNALSQEIADQEAQIQTQLASDESYMAQFDQAKQVESVANQAQLKAQQAQSDMNTKALPYQQDKLFMYLWNKHFATTEYQSGFLTRYLDSKVANLIDFQEARVNYWNLQEIPLRLQEHAQNALVLADEQRLQLQQLETDALTNAGVKNLEENVQHMRDELDQHDDKIEQAEQQLNQQLQLRTTYLAGEDQYVKQCLDRLSQVMAYQDLQEIHQYVRDTVSPTDDKLVIELRQIERSLAQVNDDLRDVRQLHDNKITKLAELENVRRNFKNQRFDDVRSGFGNESMLAGVLGQFLQGVVSGSDLWNVIQRNQRYRNVGSMPDFGSGGLGDILIDEIQRQTRRRSNSSWHWPRPRGGGGRRGGGFNIPSGRGSSGGGFSTGGQF